MDQGLQEFEASGGAVRGVLAPDFSLRDVARPADAAPVRLRALRQRRPAVLALLAGADGARNAAWLRAVAARGEDWAYYGAAVFAIAPENEARLLLAAVDTPIPLLADTDGATLGAYLGVNAALPALAVIDRYSQLAALLVAAGPESAPNLDPALHELSYADQQECACALPAWEE